MMIGIALICLVMGICGGMFIFDGSTVQAMGDVSAVALNILIISVGIDIGFNKEVFKKVKEYNLKILLIPIGIIVGSIGGSVVAGVFLGLSPNEAAAVGSGFGWYSLSAVILSDIGSAELGTMAFLSNIIREVMSIVLIPILVKYLNKYTSIATAGATSMDTLLPVITKFTDEEVAVIAVVSGVILTAVVPILVPFIYGLG